MTDTNYTNVEQQKELMKFISDNMKIPILGAGGGFAPIGTINAYMGTTAPQGWLICNGQTVNITDYPELATHFASHFGSANFFGGDGTTTIAVPDLRGEFLRGSGTNSHTNQGDGANVGVHQDGTEHCNIGMTTDDCSMYGAYSGNSEETADSLIGSHTVRYAANGATSQGQHPQFYTSRPTNTSVTYIIKATVSGDANAHQYSTEEQIVGMDEYGNYVYEKMIKTTTPSSASTDTTYSLGVSVDRYFGINVIAKRNNGRIYINNGAILGDFSTNLSVALCDNTDSEYPNSILLLARDDRFLSRPCTMIVRYTKTS